MNRSGLAAAVTLSSKSNPCRHETVVCTRVETQSAQGVYAVHVDAVVCWIYFATRKCDALHGQATQSPGRWSLSRLDVRGGAELRWGHYHTRVQYAWTMVAVTVSPLSMLQLCRVCVSEYIYIYNHSNFTYSSRLYIYTWSQVRSGWLRWGIYNLITM
jgi:hypothetical protein